MKRSEFLSLLVFGLLIIGLMMVQGTVLILAIPLILYLAYGLLSQSEESDLEISRSFSAERVSPDDKVTIKVSIHNRGKDMAEVLVRDMLPPGLTFHSGLTRRLFTLPHGASAELEYIVSGLRGTYPFENVRVEVSDELGMTHQVQKMPVGGQLLVVPGFARLRHISIRPRRTRVYAGDIPASAGGSGTEFFSVRDYQPGDSSRAINWRASARHNRMYSNEFQQERVADVGIVLDGRLRSNVYAGDRSIFDYSVLAAAALADAFLAQGNRVGMLVYSAYLDWTYPGYGKVQRERILQALTRARVGDSLVFAGLEHLSPHMFPVESQLVLISPLLPNDFEVLVQLRARGYQVMVICPDTVSFELSGLASLPEAKLAARILRLERKLLFMRLQHAGIHVIEWNVAQPFDQSVGSVLGPRFGHPIGRQP
jgi:uncharacterized repeat protein (TIGR01451 family)